MNEYYLHDKPDGEPQKAQQLWRDAHTVDSLASKIRAELEAKKGSKLFAVAALSALALLQGCIDPNAPNAHDINGTALYAVQEITLHDGVRCVTSNSKGIDCDWTNATGAKAKPLPPVEF